MIIIITVGITMLLVTIKKKMQNHSEINNFLKDADLSYEGLIKALGITTMLMLSLSMFSMVADNDSAAIIPLEEVTESRLYNDGVYIGEGQGFNGMITVEVVIENQSITSVNVIEHTDDLAWFNRANKVIPQNIIDNQEAEVAVVASATYSSNGIIQAVKDALEQSEVKQ